MNKQRATIEALKWSDVRLFFWSVEMAAEFMGVGVQRVRVLIRLGRLKPYLFNSRTLVVLREDVERLQKKPGGRPKLTETQKLELKEWLEWGTPASWMKTAHPSLIRGECPLCGVVVGTVMVPGSTVRVTVKHKPKAFKRKEVGPWTVIRRCSGSGKVPKGWRGPKVEYVSPGLAG